MLDDGTKVYDNAYYRVEFTEGRAIQEDGRTYGPGYVVRNKETDVIEFTTIILPQAKATAEQFATSLETNQHLMFRKTTEQEASDKKLERHLEH